MCYSQSLKRIAAGLRLLQTSPLSKLEDSGTTSLKSSGEKKVTQGFYMCTN